MTSGIRIERSGAVAQVILDRPEVMNRFEGPMREDLLAALRAIANDVDIRCVMVIGSGTTFSAGADIEDLVRLHERGDRAEIQRRVDLGADIVRAIRAMAKPVIAAVDGAAAGAGANLALGLRSPRRIRASSVRGELRAHRTHPRLGGFHSLVRLVGAGRAADMMMTGERIDAATAHAIGSRSESFPRRRSTTTLAMQRASRPAAHTLALIKAGLQIGANDALEQTFAFERVSQPELFSEPDCLSGCSPSWRSDDPSSAARPDLDVPERSLERILY